VYIYAKKIWRLVASRQSYCHNNRKCNCWQDSCFLCYTTYSI